MTRRILVVEDEESMRELLRLHLSSAGYAVEVAEDAIAAGYAVLKQPPDLIVCDVAMPHMDGFELVAAPRAMGARAERVSAKPVRLEELLAAVSRLLPRKA